MRALANRGPRAQGRQGSAPISHSSGKAWSMKRSFYNPNTLIIVPMEDNRSAPGPQQSPNSTPGNHPKTAPQKPTIRPWLLYGFWWVSGRGAVGLWCAFWSIFDRNCAQTARKPRKPSPPIV